MNQSGLVKVLLRNTNSGGSIGQTGEYLGRLGETGGIKFEPEFTQSGDGSEIQVGGLISLEFEFQQFGSTNCTQTKMEADENTSQDCTYVLSYNDGSTETFEGAPFTLESNRDSKPGENQSWILKSALFVSEYSDAISVVHTVPEYEAPVSGGIIVLNDTIGSYHANTIIAAISAGYGSDISSRVTVRGGSFVSCFLYCESNNGMAVIRSTTGLNAFTTSDDPYYEKGIQAFMPLGSNSSVQLTLSPDEIDSIIASGAGDTDNDTAWGNGLEFWDDDQDGNTGLDQSSYSNGVILGKILYIKEQLLCTWWEARHRARMTASESGTWNIYNGYGKIDKAAAIAYSGSIPADPFL